ncbi:hypothetical protein HanIR_Chr10g0502181 [Helianthus annuus]|nr:hypothetical protein HanIR_Chr10g0502181 [Helianthus annuus]
MPITLAQTHSPSISLSTWLPFPSPTPCRSSNSCSQFAGTTSGASPMTLTLSSVTAALESSSSSVQHMECNSDMLPTLLAPCP